MGNTQLDTDADQSGRSRQAVAAFVAGLVGLAPLGLILGALALWRIGRIRQRGRALAVIGVVLSVLWLAAGGAVLLARSDKPVAAPRPTVVMHSQAWWAAKRNIASLAPWTCFNVPDPQSAVVTVVPCHGSYERELFAQVPLDGSWPGLHESEVQAQSACIRAKFTDFTDPWALRSEGASLYYYYPDQQDWASARQARCTLSGQDPRTQSLTADLRQPVGGYSREQRALLDLGRATGLLREEILSLAPTDWVAGKPFAAQLADADRVEARALAALAPTLGTDVMRHEAAVLAANDADQARDADVLAKAASQPAWTSGVDAGVYAYAGSVEFDLLRQGIGLK